MTATLLLNTSHDLDSEPWWSTSAFLAWASIVGRSKA